MFDLFGNELTAADLVPKKPAGAEKRLKDFRYRKSEDKARRCKTCARHFEVDWRSMKIFHKCELLGDTAGSGTDVRAGWVCDAWKEKERGET